MNLLQTLRKLWQEDDEIEASLTQSKILFQIMKPSLTKTEKYTNTRITLKIRGWEKEREKGR